MLYYVILVLVLLGLVGAFLYLRNQRPDED